MPDLTITGQMPGTGADGFVVTNAAATYHDGLYTCSRIRAPAPLVSPSQCWVAYRVRLGKSAAALAAGGSALLWWRDDGTHRLDSIWVPSGGSKIRVERVGPSGTSNAVNSGALVSVAGDRLTIITAYTPTQVKISTNGTPFISASNDSIPTMVGSVLDLMSAGLGNLCMDSSALWIACGIGTLADADAAAIHGLADDDPDFRSLVIPVTAVMPMVTAAYEIPPAILAAPELT